MTTKPNPRPAPRALRPVYLFALCSLPRPVVALCSLLFALCLFPGCVTNRTLEPGGAYDSIVLYQADTIIDQTVATMEAYQQWAARNPAYLEQSQSAKLLLTKINAELDGTANPDEIIVQAIQARDLYAQLRTPDSIETLQGKLELVRQLALQLLPVMFPDGEINL